MKISLNGFVFERSKNPLKKYTVYDKNGKKITDFGARGYQHYYDRIGVYSSLNHLDEERKRRYYARHGKRAKRLSAKWFSHRFLW